MASYVKQRLAEIRADTTAHRAPAGQTHLRNQAKVAARWLACLGNSKRLLTVIQLMDGEKSVGDLALEMDLSNSAMCQHLGILLEQGILEYRAEGIWRYYSCKSEEAAAVIRMLDDLVQNDSLPDLLLVTTQRP
ncbi:ArsR family transcriptional regulator [Mesorhizobium sp. NZP2298]|nr:ArsR family transcriptional regulator [Mesorhizobium sp. NZP2298]